MWLDVSFFVHTMEYKDCTLLVFTLNYVRVTHSDNHHQRWLKPRLYQDTCCPATCVPNEQLISGNMCPSTYMLLVRDTC